MDKTPKNSFQNLFQNLYSPKQACAAEIAVLYAALACKQKHVRKVDENTHRCSNVNKHGTDGQTDRQTDTQSATQYAPPS